MNLNDKINLLYDFVYNQNTKNCFSIDKITLGKVSIDDIKLSIPESVNDDEILFYESNKTNILKGSFKILLFDEINYKIYFKKYSDQFPTTIKISFYTMKENKNDLHNSPINNDSLFSYLLSELILNNKTKHLILPFINIDIPITEIVKIVNDSEYTTKIKDLINNNIIQDVCCLQLREHFFSSITLNDYLKKNKCNYKGLLFQVIHTLAVLQKEFIGFQHNNLLLTNIFVYLKKTNDDYVEYDGFKNDKFYLPNIGFDIKITNFEKSIIPKYYDNKKYKPNQYYDLYTFMNELLLNDIDQCDLETIEFFNKYIPEKNRKKFNNIEIIKPKDLLYDKYFNNYRKMNSTTSKTSISNNQYLMGKHKIIETYMNSDNFSTLGSQKKINSIINIMTKKRIIKKEESFGKINRLRIKKDKVLIGGGGGTYEKPPYNKEKNTPFISNDEQQTFIKKKAETPPAREQPVLLEQKIYDTTKPEKRPAFPETHVPAQADFMGNVLPYSNILSQPPIQKVYNISLSNPIGNHSMINRIYEDMLPGQPHVYSALTIYERIQLSNFLKNTIIDNHDGEDMDITGGTSSLLSYIKVMDCNPYSTKSNPYHDLSKDFLLYKAAYPIRYSDKSQIEIAKQSMGMNVRMYKMTNGAVKCKSISSDITDENFDLWREIKYYNWVKDCIVRNKVSPNFISPYLYKIDTKSRLDWDKIELIKKNVQLKQDTNILIKNQQKINKLHSIKKSLGQLSLILPKVTEKEKLQDMYHNIKIKLDEETRIKVNRTDEIFFGEERDLNIENIGKLYRETIENLRKQFKITDSDEPVEDLTENSGKVLILLTEAPTTNILQWSGSVYEKFGTIRKMVSTGYHTPDVWKSILFQLVYACAVLQKSGILIENFSLKKNIFIKDIFTDYNSIGSWIYKVDNVDYYIPNHGYILMVDSQFSDINTTLPTTQDTKTKQQFKIYGKIYVKNDFYDQTQLDKNIIDQFKNVINPNNFRQEFSVDGGCKPDQDIIDLIGKIHNSINDDTQISNLIPTFFSEFIHNRVGTLLLKSEKENINKTSKPNFMKGNLMVYEKRFDEYEWVIYLNDCPNCQFRKEIIVKEHDKYIRKSIYPGSLIGYPENEKIIPASNSRMKYDDKHIYETYNLDNII